MEQKKQNLLNGLADLRPLLKEAKVKAPTDTIWKKFPEASRTTIYRCLAGDGKHERLFEIRKMAIKMIKDNNKKIGNEAFDML